MSPRYSLKVHMSPKHIKLVLFVYLVGLFVCWLVGWLVNWFIGWFFLIEVCGPGKSLTHGNPPASPFQLQKIILRIGLYLKFVCTYFRF